MNKVAEFYTKAMADETTAAEFAKAIGGKALDELGDAEFEKLGELAQKLGFTISAEEAKEYLSPKEGEIADDELDAVAGGKEAPFSEKIMLEPFKTAAAAAALATTINGGK